MQETGLFRGEAVLGLRFWYVLFADRGAKAELDHASQLTGGNVRTARVVAEIFREFFFVAVWSCKPRLYGYPGRGEPPNPDSYIMFWIEGLCASDFGVARTVRRYSHNSDALVPRTKKVRPDRRSNQSPPIPPGNSLHAEHSHVGFALQETFRVVPKIDPADSALPGARQIDLSALPAFGNAVPDIEWGWHAAIVGNHQPLQVQGCAGHFKLDAAEIVEWALH